ncbi:MAG: methyltransferase domain-containing protein [Nocardioidaceae bacterium]|nr:methyltransferase domain-containing protein [Nocardioidaceae bacterium]
MTAVEQQPNVPVSADNLAERLLGAALGAADILSIYLGDRLGWYRSLLTDGPATCGELAERTGTHPRYAREWLEQQAVTGLLTVDSDAPDDPVASGGYPAASRRFSLPTATAEVLTDEHSLAFLAPLPRMFAAAAGQLPALLEAYRNGGGVSWKQYGVDARESQADMNRPWYERVLPDALRGVTSVDQVLRRPHARIADIGCGAGWSSIALARAYPEASIDGFDIDAASIELARSNAWQSGMSDRIRFHAGDAVQMPESAYDAVFAFECVHDMPRPVEVLAAARRALVATGTVIVMDEAVAESFTAPGDEIERLMYGFSLLVCLPDGMAHQPSAATGTVMRLDRLRNYAHDAGFLDVDVLPIQDFGFWRFYQLSGQGGPDSPRPEVMCGAVAVEHAWEVVQTAKVIARWAWPRAISASAVGSRRLLSKLTHHSQKYGQIAPLLLL